MKYFNAPHFADMHYDHEPVSNVIHLNVAHARANAQQAAQLVEAGRTTFEVVPTLQEERRLWDAYMAAIRKSVTAAADVNSAHNAWLSYREKVLK